MTDTTVSEIADIHRLRRSHWHSHFIYRGEGSTSNTLRPRFGRYLAEALDSGGRTVFPSRDHEQSLLTEFKRQSSPFLDRRPADEWDWLSVAQHHGLATRLLDWTSNILVAAYFACSAKKAGDAVIYALDTKDMPIAPENQSPFALSEDVILYPRHSTARITAQAGLFTSHADPKRPFARPTLQRIILPSALLIELRLTLETYDVHKARLFPGLDSLAELVNSTFGCE